MGLQPDRQKSASDLQTTQQREFAEQCLFDMVSTPSTPTEQIKQQIAKVVDRSEHSSNLLSDSKYLKVIVLAMLSGRDAEQIKQIKQILLKYLGATKKCCYSAA